MGTFLCIFRTLLRPRVRVHCTVWGSTGLPVKPELLYYYCTRSIHGREMNDTYGFPCAWIWSSVMDRHAFFLASASISELECGSSRCTVAVQEVKLRSGAGGFVWWRRFRIQSSQPRNQPVRYTGSSRSDKPTATGTGTGTHC